MEHLWAPWRRQYVEKGREDNLSDTFAVIGQSLDDREHFVLSRSRAGYGVLNRYPYNTAHTLVVPYRKVAQIEDLSEAEWSDLTRLMLRIKGAIQRVYQPDGFNIGINLGSAAGAGIEEHLHIHLVPRWRNDANFMTTVGATRVHPSALEEVWQALRGVLESS
ncbi:MAG: HIT domain-containing protein [Methylacidiphilales bacterium]|nr:HIT domain-containing protein [Candidatus Methylacidiphilales bacterium]MDW8349659.1 HIT domain-containing protein [Verrucomicrobiae bacterium]